MSKSTETFTRMRRGASGLVLVVVLFYAAAKGFLCQPSAEGALISPTSVASNIYYSYVGTRVGLGHWLTSRAEDFLVVGLIALAIRLGWSSRLAGEEV